MVKAEVVIKWIYTDRGKRAIFLEKAWFIIAAALHREAVVEKVRQQNFCVEACMGLLTIMQSRRHFLCCALTNVLVSFSVLQTGEEARAQISEAHAIMFEQLKEALEDDNMTSICENLSISGHFFQEQVR